MNQLNSTINQLISILSQNKTLNFTHKNFPLFKDEKIITPIGNIGPQLKHDQSSLPNNLVSLDKLQNLLTKLQQKNSLIRLSHIGFCYQVASQKKEVLRLIGAAKTKKISLYEEPSNDAGKWLFLGNISNWQNPVIEFIPIENTNDPNSKYWLPHIQIDVDTKLSGEAIETIVKTVFDKEITPFPIKIDGITYIIRNRLGIINGVNIFLDLATSSRSVKYLRQDIWKKIV